MKILRPHTTGVELPRSGNAARQRTFSFVLQWSGKFFSAATPAPSGPRQAGQFAASNGVVNMQKSQPHARFQHAAVALAPYVFLQGMDGDTK
jgi:hypothetical protein